jgi:CubicO group peptidase (beta-lactamase class C family)
MKEVNDILLKEIEAGSFPGASYAIVNESGFIALETLGYFRLFPEKEKNHEDVIYDVASLTKVISTTTMVMKLIEDQKLRLDTPVCEVLKAFKHPEVTIYHLLTHTSGLPADIYRANTLKSRQEVIEKVYQSELIHPVGDKIVYSDIGFILLGFVIETLTGKTLSIFADEVIFKPLGMKDTGYHPMKEKAAPTELRNDTVYQGYLQGLVHDEKAFALGGEAGHAGLFSTTKDIGLFMQAILKGSFVLKNETLDLLFPMREERKYEDGTHLARALGWDKPTGRSSAGAYVDFDESIIHTGFTGCNMFIDRKHEVGFVMLSNDVHPSRLTKGILKIRHEIGTMVVSKKGSRL